MVHESKSKTSKKILEFVFHYLSELDVLEGQKHTTVIKLQKWEPPQEGWVNMNFDVAFCKGSSKLGFGVMLRDFNGKVLLSSSSFRLNVSVAFAAEALTVLDAVKLGSLSGFLKVILEGDSLTITWKCSSDLPDFSEISPFIRDIKRYGRNFQEIQFRHTDRLAIKVANALAKEALKKGIGSYLVQSAM